MIQECSSLTSDVSVIRRLIFAARNINEDSPECWELVSQFEFNSTSMKPCVRKVQTFVENLGYLEEESFFNDAELQRELHQLEGYQAHLLEIILISSKKHCHKCGGKLLVRADRPSFPVVYNEDIGTVSGTHFQKCEHQSKGCHFVQHYGFNCTDEVDGIVYDDEYFKSSYFMSTSMTVFQITMLHRFTAEMLIGQLSYKQKAEIYNYCHGYESKLKKTIPGRLTNMAYDKYVFVSYNM